MGQDDDTKVVMETNVFQVYLNNDIVCPVGSVLVLDSGNEGQQGRCSKCPPNTYNANPLTGTCNNCPLGVTCINGKAVLGASKVTAEVDLDLPDAMADDTKQAMLAERLGLDIWRITIPLPASQNQQLRVVKKVMFEIWGESSEIVSLSAKLAEKGVVVKEAETVGREISDEEVWEVKDGVYYLRKCPAGKLLINTTLDLQECKPCLANTYLLEGSTECAKCPSGATCVVEPGSCPSCLEGVNFIPITPGSVWSQEISAEGVRSLRISSCPQGTALIRDVNNALGDKCETCSGYSLEMAEWRGNQTETGTGFFCRECPRGMICKGGSNLAPSEDFWVNPSKVLISPASVVMHDPHIQLLTSKSRRTESRSLKAFRCAPGACLSDWTCKKGHYGRICGLCNSTRVDGKFFAMGAGGCAECKETSKPNLIAMIFICVLSGFVLWYVTVWRWWFRIEKFEDAVLGGAKRLLEALRSAATYLIHRGKAKVPLRNKFENVDVTGYFKVLVSFYQVTSRFLPNYDIAWPEIIKKMLQRLTFFSLDFFSLPGTECLRTQSGQQTRLHDQTQPDYAYYGMLH
jgi:hypothetical protein